MQYSDKELLVASQLAYLDFNPSIVRSGGNKLTIQELLEKDSAVFDRLNAALNKEEAKGKNASFNKITKIQDELKLYEEIRNGQQPYCDWIIKDIKDDNNNSGFYGLLIDTGNNNAIVGFRGSEGDGKQFEKDWVNADFSMLNAEIMEQQKKATEYMDEINSKFGYDSYATAGHSLGGNLSFFAAITAPPSMRAKIIQSVNADGPGFSLEMLLRPDYAAGIRDMAPKMKHFQWSLVGALLNPVPGVDYISVKTKDLVYGKFDLDSLTTKHSLLFVETDENGNVIKGKMDRFAESIGRLSRETDESPSPLGNALISGIKSFSALSQSEKVIFGGALVANIALFALTHPVATVAALVVVAAIAVVGWTNPEFYGEVLIPFILNTASAAQDLAQQFIDGINSLIIEALEAYNVASDFINQLMNEIGNVLSSFTTWVQKAVNSGYRYASNHPVIKVDTNKLRDYAERIDSVNRRLKNLDHRMDSLYWKVGFLDLLSLIQADLLTHKSLALTLCSSYLNETAEDFETAERNILNRL